MSASVPGYYPLVLEIEPDPESWPGGRCPAPQGYSCTSVLFRGHQSALVGLDLGEEGAQEVLESLMAEKALTWNTLDYLIFTQEVSLPGDFCKNLVLSCPSLTFLIPETLKRGSLVDLLGPGVKTYMPGDTLDLGGKTLEFLGLNEARGQFMVWDIQEGVLFSGLLASSLGWTEEKTWYDELNSGEKGFWEDGLVDFYAQGLSCDLKLLNQGMKVLEERDVKVILPAYGTGIRKDLGTLKNLLHSLGELHENPPTGGLCLVGESWGAFLEDLRDRLTPKYEEITIFDLETDSALEILRGILESRTMVIAAPSGTKIPGEKTLKLGSLLEKTGLLNRFCLLSGYEDLPKAMEKWAAVAPSTPVSVLGGN